MGAEEGVSYVLPLPRRTSFTVDSMTARLVRGKPEKKNGDYGMVRGNKKMRKKCTHRRSHRARQRALNVFIFTTAFSVVVAVSISIAFAQQMNQLRRIYRRRGSLAAATLFSHHPKEKTIFDLETKGFANGANGACVCRIFCNIIIIIINLSLKSMFMGDQGIMQRVACVCVCEV